MFKERRMILPVSRLSFPPYPPLTMPLETGAFAFTHIRGNNCVQACMCSNVRSLLLTAGLVLVVITTALRAMLHRKGGRRTPTSPFIDCARATLGATTLSLNPEVPTIVTPVDGPRTVDHSNALNIPGIYLGTPRPGSRTSAHLERRVINGHWTFSTSPPTVPATISNFHHVPPTTPGGRHRRAQSRRPESTRQARKQQVMRRLQAQQAPTMGIMELGCLHLHPLLGHSPLARRAYFKSQVGGSGFVDR